MNAWRRGRCLLRWTWLALFALLTACGGGGGASTTTSSSSTIITGANAIPVTIHQFAQAQSLTVNIPYVTLTLCNAGGSCVDVPDVLLDTGSTGLRINASALGGLVLPSITPTGGSGVLGECSNFASGYIWGGMHMATVKLGQESTLAAVPVQLYDDSSIPANGGSTYCTGSTTNLVASGNLAANGILGVSNLRLDGGSSTYFSCGSTSCSPTTASGSQQAINPVASMPAGFNNGVLVVMPAVKSSGVSTATGSLVLGINSATNNQLASSAQIYPLDQSGNLSLNVSGTQNSISTGFIDSGSNGLLMNLPSVRQCQSGGFYCPVSPVQMTITLNSGATSSGPLSMTIADMSQTTNLALPELGGPWQFNSNSIADLGLPFFYGRTIAIGIQNAGSNSPYGFDAF